MPRQPVALAGSDARVGLSIIMPSVSKPSTPPVQLNLLVLTLLCMIWAQATGSSARTSLTIDEGLHITSGYTILRTGDFRLVEEHPPLVKLLEALPLLLMPDLPDPTTLSGWDSDVAVTNSVRLVGAAKDLVYPYQPIDRLVFAARVPVALLAVLLGAVVFRWASDLWGRSGGLIALSLLAFDPNILAHGSVAGTDLGAALFITLALFLLVRFMRRSTISLLVLAGVALGLAQGAKLSSVMLLPVVVLLVLLRPARLGVRLFSLVSLLLIAFAVLWGIYAFELEVVAGVPFPVPASSHHIPWLRLRQHMTDGHAAFLVGENRLQGWWYYFPVAFVLKSPLPVILALLSALAVFCRGPRRPLLDEGGLLLFPLLYAGSSLLSPLNIGYRHLLPILPFLFIFSGRLAVAGRRVLAHGSRLTCIGSRIICCAFFAWHAVGTVRLFPHYLAYFNELAGGPDGGWRFLADSNTDWGQGYKDLARFQQERGTGPVRLSAFIFYDPAIYGVEYEPLTPMRGDTPPIFPSRFNPPPGEYVISATTLDGIPLVDPEMYDWFRKHEPDARIAHVLFYYHIPPQHPVPAWLAQCTIPTVPLSPEVASEGFGRDDLRLAAFDCTQAWLYPDGGRSPGWYALYRGEETEEEFTRVHSAPARLVYEQRLRHQTPPFAAYEWSPLAPRQLLAGVKDESLIVAPSEWTLARAEAEGAMPTAPISLSETMAFLGYRIADLATPPGESLVLWTYWSIEAPVGEPLSLMAHLVDGAGVPVAIGDGLGVPVESWQTGDIIVQRHVLDIPPDTEPGTYWIQTGAYTLMDLRRLEITLEHQAGGDRIVLSQLEIGS